MAVQHKFYKNLIQINFKKLLALRIEYCIEHIKQLVNFNQAYLKELIIK